jgi:tetratricopeptide (TPR) repeat protein
VPLELEAERLFPVKPLPLPNDFRDLTALRSSPVVQLLVEAAQGVRPGFAVMPENAQSVLLLCRTLDGIPLAIELAAAKLAVMTPAQVVASIGRRIDLSTTRANFAARHRSLETVIEWSLGLLDERERRAFAMLGVCRGGFNARLATKLLGTDAEEILQRLSRCSLIGWSESGREVRFEMLETVREIARQMLDDDPSLLREATKLQFEFALELCERYDALGGEEERAEWVREMDADSGNLLSALESATRGIVDAETAWRFALPLQQFIERHGRSQVWVSPLEDLLEATRKDLDPAARARAHILIAKAHYGLRNIRATYHHNKLAIESADQSGDLILRIESRSELASAAITLGEFDETQAALEVAAELLESTNDPRAAAYCHLNLAWVIFDRGQEEDSEPSFRRAVELAETSGHAQTLGSSLTGLAVAVGDSRYQEATPLFEKAIAHWKSAGMPGFLAHCFYYRALIDYRHGELDRALANLERGFRLFVESGVALGQTAQSVCGNAMAAAGRHEHACACWGRADAARRRYDMRMIPSIKRDFDREFPKVQASLTPARLDELLESMAESTDAELTELLFGPQEAAVTPQPAMQSDATA